MVTTASVNEPTYCLSLSHLDVHVRTCVRRCDTHVSVSVCALGLVSMLCVVILGCRCPAIHREEEDTFEYKKMTLDVLPNLLQLLPKITTQRAGTHSCPLHISLGRAMFCKCANI